MSERLMKVKNCDVFTDEVWEVLTPDLRVQEFQGSYFECILYLRATLITEGCSSGGCEE